MAIEVPRQADVAAFAALFSPRTPVRAVAVYMWVTMGLDAAAWLARIVPAVTHGGPPAYLRGTGLTVNVVYVQDLALWLPLLAVAAAWLWRRRPWGYLLAGAGLVMWVLESTSIAVGVRPGLAAGYLAGLLLIAWIAVELLILRRYFFLQPVIAGIGTAEILLAWRWQRSGTIVTGSRDQRL
jgi:hypothetical protein